ncbi:hypothetical protein [Cedecea davisae]|uniref:hypothetical protein n=1 Tax=Cedecea davisae TaxID=158484 RepID=UPI00242AECFC|nr:hypothetical protein [Cedecea davisae]
MPISASQHRTSIGTSQNKLHDIFGKYGQQPQVTTSKGPATPDEILRVGKNINHVANFYLELNRSPPQNTAPRQGLTASLMLLLSQLRLENNQPPAPSGSASLISTSNLLQPISNALHASTEFISSHDPLIFPGAESAPVCSGSHRPDDIVNTLNKWGFNVVTRGLDELKCFELDKYEFFKGVAYNAIKTLDSAILQLEDKNNDELDNHLRHYGIVDPQDIKSRLIPLYNSIKSDIAERLKSNRNSVYYGYSSTGANANITAASISDDHNKVVFLTDNFFGKCTLNAINALIHEVAHHHSKVDLFQIIKEKSCLDDKSGSEIPVHAQLDDVSDDYSSSTRKLEERNIFTDLYIGHLYNMNITEFVDIFNTNSTIKEEALFINADSISHQAIALGNYGFKKNGTMPLLDTSEFKTGEAQET